MIFTLLATGFLVIQPVQGLLVNKTSTVSLSLQTLQEVLDGPLTSWDVVLYCDPDLDMKVSVVDQLLALPALQDSSLILADLGTDGALWSRNQPASVLRGTHVIHIVVFKKDPRPFFQAVSLQWNPKYVMLFSLAVESFQTLLVDNVFGGIERLVLLEKLISSSQRRGTRTRIYTSLPFSKVQPVILLGIWNSETFSSHDDIFVDRYKSFEDYEFHLATWLDDNPYLYQSTKEAEGVGDGVVAEMLDAMAPVLDYSYDLTITPPDGQWGSFENGSWSGMLGMVLRQEKNFTVNSFFLTDEQVEAFDASVSYWTEGFGVAMMYPAPLAKWRAAYYPFMPAVWAYVGATFAIVVVTMTLQDRIQPEPFLGGLGRTWPYLLRAVVNHSLPVLPTAQWQRVLVGSWWLYCFILTTAYTANLIAFLTIPVFPERIQTLEELAHSDYRVTMLDYGDFVPGALRTSENKVYKALGDKLDLFMNYDVTLQPMLSGTHAFIEGYSYGIFLLYIEYKITNSYMLKDQLYPGHVCWYFQKNTAWKYKFDQGIQRLVEAGLISYWVKSKMDDSLGRDFDLRQRLADEEQRDNKQPLSLEHLQGVFFILLLSWMASAVVFIVEFLLYKC